MKAKPAILVVDDQPQNIELLEAYLVPQGYEIVKAANGEEALEKLSGNQIDLILLDVIMPGMDGFEVTRRVRQDDKTRLLPIILVTVLWETEDRVKGIEAGCDDFLSKPVDKTELLARVRSLLKVKAGNDLMSNYQEELESEVTRRTNELKHALENLQQEITERKRTEEALLDSEVRYRTLFEISADGILIADIETKTFKYANPALCRMLGYTEEKLKTLSLADIHPKEDLPRVIAEFEAQARGDKTLAPDIPCLRKDGTILYADINAATFTMDGRPYNVGFFRDITERKRTEEALQESMEKYRLVVENAGDAILVAQDGMLKFVNPKTLELIGYTEPELTSRPFGEFVYPEDRKMVVDRYLKRLRGEDLPLFYPFRIVTKEGMVRWVEIHAVAITWQGRPATLNFLSNIDERMQAEEQVKIHLNKIETALESTVKALGVTSELRDPYTAGHQRRVTQLASAIARDMGFTENRIKGIRVAGLLHDIGKILIPAEILNKPSKLTEVEFAIVKTHAMASYDILKSIEFPWPVAQIVIQHHEKLNGSGYPSGLKGDEIIMEARILCVADIVEAMSSHRPYRPALGIDVALGDMLTNKGVLYDPNAVDSCVKLFREKGFKFE
jgi:PAS domain S-box-containing protein/putative nucleotidyltransferase with HDIG domain